MRDSQSSDSSSESSPIWQDVVQMVFDAMHSNGVLRNHLSSIHSNSSSGNSIHSQYHHHNGHPANGSASNVTVGSTTVSLGGTEGIFHGSSEAMVISGGDDSGGPTHLSGIDGWQRKPLLNHDNSPEGLHQAKWGYPKDGPPHISHAEYYDDDDDDADGESSIHCNGRNGMVKIPLPSPEREEPKFPKEKWKTLWSFAFLCANLLLTSISLSIIHERLPDRSKNPPLPDIIFDLVEPVDWGLTVSEIIILVSTSSSLLVVLLHKHRFILFRRVFLITGLLYMMRSITMFVTQVPVASTTYFCSPKANSTSPIVILRRVIHLMSGFGLSINGKHTYCGDYIYSGHTVILTFCYLLIKEYTPRRCFLLHWLSWLLSIVGVVMVLISRGHYTVDVIIAYYVTTRLFWMYHTMANNINLKTVGPNNLLSRVWWFSMFQYFEGNISGVVPRQYEWPLPWPRRFTKHDRNS